MRNLGGVFALLLAACAPGVSGSVDAAPERPDAAPRLPEGDHHTFVIDSITLPTNGSEAQDLGLDLDGDGDVDNQLGSIISLLSSNGRDINAVVKDQIDQGNINHLTDLQATALDSATNTALYVWKGANPMPSPCLDITDLTTCRQHLMGTGSFDVASTDPADALIFGGITNGHFSGDRGVITLDVPLFVADQGLTLQMIGARSEVDVAADALTNGRLAGAVTETYIHDNVLPQLHNVLNVVVERDCHGTSPTCCDANTDGETVVNLFDSDGSCTVTLQELYDSGLLQSLLAPDVDLLDEEGLSGADGVLDSLSLGIGYTSVPATYAIPSGLP